MRRIFLLVALCLFAAIANAQPYAGRPLADALRDLQSKGLRLIYSSDVVRPDMTVSNEPGSKEPRKVLDELLHEHGLHVEKGPRGSLIVVRDNAAQAATPAATAERPTLTALEEIVVTPSQYKILGGEPESRQFLSREEVRRLPHLSDDLYRAISRVPGTASYDITARFNIRGGEEDEVQVLLDGVEVYDPFHLRDLFRAFSTIDSESVGSVEVLTGGFPAQYGGRMSGVIDIASFTPEQRRTEIGISLLNTRVLSAGRFDQDRGEWLFSIRRGYLRELLKLVQDPEDEDISPTYYDLLGKLQMQLGDSTVVSANVLAARDEVKVEESDPSEAEAKYNDAYAWINARTSVTPRFFTQNVLSYGRLARRRDGQYGTTETTERGALRERRAFDFVALKHDSSFDITAKNVFKWGLTGRRLHADYDYHAAATIKDSLFNFNMPPIEIRRATDLDLTGNEFMVYVADRIRLTQRLVVEGGGRIERQTWTPDGTNFSPRLNLAFALGPRTSIRAGWGRFYQAQQLGELQVEDGINEFFPAQRADHILIGVDQAIRSGLLIRAEAYEKRMSDLRPRFENIYDKVILFPELREDRTRIDPETATARGAEILLRSESSGPFSGWISFAHASVRDEVGGKEIPRSWDQRTAVNFSANWQRGTRWNFNVAGIFHSGWPTTPAHAQIDGDQVHIVIGPRNDDRLPDYKRIDFRASRNFPVGRGGLSFFLELYNVLNFSNVTRVESFNFKLQPDGSIPGTPTYESVIGILPSFGVTYQF